MGGGGGVVLGIRPLEKSGVEVTSRREYWRAFNWHHNYIPMCINWKSLPFLITLPDTCTCSQPISQPISVPDMVQAE